MLPTAIPAVTAFGIFSVVAHWNDYFWPLIAVNSTHLFTPPVGVAHFRNAEAGTDYGPLMAAATIIIAPLILAFLLAQRRFIEGITFTGMK
jgi:multiple sugar transport system permease protein